MNCYVIKLKDKYLTSDGCYTKNICTAYLYTDHNAAVVMSNHIKNSKAVPVVINEVYSEPLPEGCYNNA